jgi:hypothetical protein
MVWVFLATAIELNRLNAKAPNGHLGLSDGPPWADELIARASVVTPAQEHVPPNRTASAPAPGAVKTNIPYVEAKSVLESLREDLLPIELRAKTSAERESAWPGWVSRRDADIRARLVQADEDSILNFLFFGTTFTKQPRVRNGDASLGGEPEAVEVVRRRLDDMVAGIASPGGNERLRFARNMVERKGINPTSVAGRDQTRFYLGQIITRVVGEREHYDTVRDSVLRSEAIVKFAAHSTLFRERGLSPDTSIFVNVGTEQALEAIKSQGIFGAGEVRHVAIVGPGLDFTDKKEGYDFYPPQTIQPFAVIDSLIRLGLALPDGVQMATLDLSPRINQHLEAARQRSRADRAYIIELTRDATQRWNPSLVTYWELFGDRIGTKAKAVAAPADAGSLQVRAIRVRPALVRSTIPWDVNVVLQRLQPVEAGGLFDLIIATNVLVYYDVFEQSLALANVAKMLRPGGLFLSNDLVFELPATPMNLLDFTDVVYTDVGNGDRFVWYQRQ